jgi:hypothetical protein
MGLRPFPGARAGTAAELRYFDGEAQTVEAELQRIRSGGRWSGYLTLENAEAVAGRIRVLLEGRTYVFVSYLEGMNGGFPEVRMGRQVEELTLDRKPLDNGQDYACIRVVDTCGVWDLSTTAADQKTAWDHAEKARNETGKSGVAAYVRFTSGDSGERRAEILQRNGLGEQLRWVVGVQAAE